MNNEIFLGLSLLIILGMALIFFIRKVKQTSLPSVGRDALRKKLWEQGWELKEVRNLSFRESFSAFGLALFPNASYLNKYFLKVETTSDDGEKKDFLAMIVLVFNKDVQEIELK